MFFWKIAGCVAIKQTVQRSNKHRNRYVLFVENSEFASGKSLKLFLYTFIVLIYLCAVSFASKLISSF